MNIDTLLQFHRPNHSNVQMDCLITGKTGLTEYGRFKQAVRELSVRRIAYLETQLEIIEMRSVEPSTEVEAFRQRLKFQSLTAGLKNTLRELTRFYHQACYYYTSSKVDASNIEALERDLAVTQLGYQAGLEILANGHASIGTISAIAALPKSYRAHLLGTIKKDPFDLVENVLNWDPPYEPRYSESEIAEVQAMLEYTGPRKELLEWSHP